MVLCDLTSDLYNGALASQPCFSIASTASALYPVMGTWSLGGEIMVWQEEPFWVASVFLFIDEPAFPPLLLCEGPGVPSREPPD